MCKEMHEKRILKIQNTSDSYREKCDLKRYIEFFCPLQAGKCISKYLIL